MVLSFFAKHKQDKQSVVLLVDIGSASVGVALARIEEGKPPHILATVREDIVFQEELSSRRFVLAMNRALEHTLKKISGVVAIHGSPARVFCTLSSPWFVLRGRKIEISREKPFIVTYAALDEFITKDIEEMKKELQGSLPVSDMAIIEKKIVQMRLNGYDIRNPYGQTTSRIELSLTVGVSSARAIKSIENIVRRAFRVRDVQFGVFPVAAFNAIRDIFSGDQHALAIDITGEATDISVLQKDVLEKNIAFPYGKNFFIRELSAGLHTPHEDAGAVFRMFLSGTLTEKDRVVTERVMRQAEEVWMRKFEEALDKLADRNLLPRTVFFISDTDIKDLFLTIFAKSAPRAISGDVFNVQYLESLIVAQFATFDTGVVRDPFLVIEALLAAKVLKGGNV